MPEPTESVFEAAARAKILATIPGITVAIANEALASEFTRDIWLDRGLRAAVDAVWRLAVAQGQQTGLCPCMAERLRPHPPRDNGPDCSWCGRPAMDPVHDPRQGRVVGAEIKAEVNTDG